MKKESHKKRWIVLGTVAAIIIVLILSLNIFVRVSRLPSMSPEYPGSKVLSYGGGGSYDALMRQGRGWGPRGGARCVLIPLLSK